MKQTVTRCGYCGDVLAIDGSAISSYDDISKGIAIGLIESGCEVLHGWCDRCRRAEDKA